jgi:hypothetical protein
MHRDDGQGVGVAKEKNYVQNGSIRQKQVGLKSEGQP